MEEKNKKDNNANQEVSQTSSHEDTNCVMDTNVNFNEEEANGIVIEILGTNNN